MTTKNLLLSLKERKTVEMLNALQQSFLIVLVLLLFVGQGKSMLR